MFVFINKFLSLAVLVAATAANFSSHYAIQKPRTILDYYLLVPQQFLGLQKGDSRAARESAISIRDLDHGYLQTGHQVAETYTTRALFDRPDGNDPVAIEARSCVRGCISTLNFLLFENQQWIDVTGKTLPVIDDPTLRGILNKHLTSRDGSPADFQPRLLYTLSKGGSTIDVSEHWSGMAIGQLEWTGDNFVFKPGASADDISGQSVLASVSNTSGDRLQIIGVTPDSPAKLPLKGHLRVRVAYDLKSARACHIWVHPVIVERRLPDDFFAGSMLHKRGSGVATRFFGFNNQAHIDQLEVVMKDEQHKELLTLTYNVDADWEGVLQCPSLRVSCFSNSPNSAVQSGVRCTRAACAPVSSSLTPGLSPAEISSAVTAHIILR